MIDTIISTQCVNYRRCGGNVTLLPGTGSGLETRAEIIGHTCACSYSDDDVTWFDGEVVRGRARP